MSDEYFDDMVLEPDDDMVFEPEYDTVLEPKDDNLDGSESNSTYGCENSLRSSTLSQGSSQFLFKRKKIEIPGSSPVKEFYEAKLINNFEYWVYRHKTCTPKIKYLFERM